MQLLPQKTEGVDAPQGLIAGVLLPQGVFQRGDTGKQTPTLTLPFLDLMIPFDSQKKS
jgi:hypothetical protein